MAYWKLFNSNSIPEFMLNYEFSLISFKKKIPQYNAQLSSKSSEQHYFGLNSTNQS